MEYLLVLQFPASSIKDYDVMVEFENAIIKNLGSLGEVDGHDFGSGEMNIFILTYEPKLAFEHITRLFGDKGLMSFARVAYRPVGEDQFTILHPKDLKHFDVA